MTPERLQEIKKHRDRMVGSIRQPDEQQNRAIDDLIAFAETALPLMTVTNVFVDPDTDLTDVKFLGRFTKGEIAMPSRGFVAMHLMAAQIARVGQFGLDDHRVEAEMAIKAADALIAELQRKK